MTADGTTRLDLADPELVRALAPLGGIVSRFHKAEILGLEHLPREGAALLVANHGLFGTDTFVFGLELFRRTGRLPRGLMDRFFFTLPPLAAFMQRIGAIKGDRAHGLAALRAGELVLVYPGGAREVNKLAPEERYRLMWERSKGFVRLAVAAAAPVIFVAGTGVDDHFEIKGAVPAGLARLLFGHEKYRLPVVFPPLPRRAPFRFTLHAPERIPLPPEAADDAAAVDAAHAALWKRCQGLLDACVASSLLRSP